MKLVFQKVPLWEGIPHAEEELSLRLKRAADVIGLDSIASSNIEEINSFKPDIIIPLHFFLPKLFDAFTIGCMWNPVPYFTERSQQWDLIKSYDGYGIASSFQEQLVRRIKLKSPSPYLLLPFYPSANAAEYEKPKTLGTPVYIGTNWTNTRHRDLFLKSRNIHVYGREDRWKHLPAEIYRGELPFGGQNVIAQYRTSGIGLALHHQAHIDESIPCMRPFEIAASGAVMIADQNPFVKEAFGDSVLYIDTDRETQEVIDALEQHCNWIDTHRSQAFEMAHACNEIFNRNYSLEVLLKNLIDSVGQFESKSSGEVVDDIPDVEIIIRWDFKIPESSLRALDSVLSQSYGHVRAILAVQGTEQDCDEIWRMAAEHCSRLSPETLEIIQISANQSWLFEGIRKSRAVYVGFVGCETVLFSDHVEALVHILEHNKAAAGGYSGVVKQNGTGSADTLHLSCYFDFDPEEGTELLLPCGSMLLRRKNLPWQILHQKLPRLFNHDEAVFRSLLVNSRLAIIFSEKVTCKVELAVISDYTAVSQEELVKSVMEKASTCPEAQKKHAKHFGAVQAKKGLRERLIKILPGKLIRRV